MIDSSESPNAPRAWLGGTAALNARLARETGAALAHLGSGRIDLILASASPRRRELLRPLLPNLEVIPADIAEVPRHGETPGVFAARSAREKADYVATLHPRRWILGADTVVTIDGEILGKPRDAGDAARMLQTLSGRTHRVCTAIAILVAAESSVCQVVETEVTFRPMTATEIGVYVAGGEPFDKAGAYGIQGGGGRFVTAVSGSYSNVIGLPLLEVARQLVRLRDTPG